MVQDRIKHLERLLAELMRSQQQQQQQQKRQALRRPEYRAPSAPSTPDHGSSPPAASSSDCGSIHLTKSGTSYVNSAHWAAVLNGIDDLKGHFEDEEPQPQPQRNRPDETGPPLFGEAPAPPRLSGPQLLYGCSVAATKEEILASIPPRPVVDQLVSCYFNSFEMSPAVLHSGQFLHEYAEFWKSPSASSIIWVGLLFTLMCLASQFQRHRLDPNNQTPEMLSTLQHLHDRVETFRQRIVQCLIMGDYVKGGPHVLETLVLYLATELFGSSDAEAGMWMLVGTITQLAMRMGYHRDPKHFPCLTPFAGEMQRRVWITIVEADLGVSAQMGLPRLIKPWQVDTSEPSNLLDSDFDLTASELPPSRPETDLTPVLFRIVWARISKVVGAVWDLATNIRPCRHADVLSMDRDLQEAHASIPECLKWRSRALCIADSPQVVIQKVTLEMVVHRARIVLHRRYLRPPAEDTQYGHSRQKCLGAALALLEFQEVLHEKTEPLGQLSQERWRVSSLVTHHFLLAVSVLCSYLQQAHDHDEAPRPEGGGADITTGAIRNALRRSHEIWARSSALSKEAQKAAKALSVVLGIESPAQAAPEAGNTPHVAASPAAPYAGMGEFYQEYPPGFGLHIPIFDATSWASWPGQTGVEPTASFLTWVPPTGLSPFTMNAMDPMGPTQWQ